MRDSSHSSYFSQFCSSALRAKPLSNSSDVVRINSGEGLVRRLGPFDLILLGIGASIGAGIFVVTGTVARDAGPGVTISFLLAGASCVLNALCYAELASRFPAVVGGAYLYAYTAFNELTAFLVFTQMMLDYHIGAASIARSLASYVVNILELIPFLKNNIPNWVGHGGKEIFGFISINLLAPVLLVLLTLILCRGVGESSLVNTIMTTTKIVIVVVVIIVGAFEVDASNWSPFAPNGFKSMLTGATVAFFAYVGFDAVANSAEESKRPQAGYSVVAACVITLRWKDNISSQVSATSMSHRLEGIICITVIACCGFTAGILFRYVVSLFAYIFLIIPIIISLLAAAALQFRQEQMDPPGFSCPWVPMVPALCIFVNIFLFAQLHYEAWVRFIVLSIVAVGVYAFYGQHHANPTVEREVVTYHKAPEEEVL